MRDLRRHWLVTLCVVASLALAAMGITVVHIASVETVRNLESTGIRTSYQYVVPIATNEEKHYFELRRDWRSGALPTIEAMVPILEGTTEAEGRLVQVLGIDVLADTSGSFDDSLSSQDTGFLTQNTLIAIGSDWTVGDVVNGSTVIASTPSRYNLFIADLPTAQGLLGRPGQIDAVWMRRKEAEKFSFVERIWPGLLTGLGYRAPPLEVEGYQIQSMSSWNPLHSFSGSIAFNLSLLGALAILVSGFIAYEACSNNVRRRRLEMDRLGALGVDQWQLRGTFLIEALLIGAIGSLLGIGIAIAFLQLLQLVDVSDSFNVVLIASFKSVAVSIGTLLFAIHLATSKSNNRIRKSIYGLLVAICLGLLLWGAFPVSGLLGAFVVMVGMCILQVLIVVPAFVGLVSRIGLAVSLTRLTWLMVLRQAIKQFRSFRVPVSAFSIAIATAIGISLMVTSFRTNFEDMLDVRLRPGLHIESASEFDTSVASEWEAVENLRSYYRTVGRLAKGPVNLTATNLDAWETSRYGYDSAIERGTMINRQLAMQHNLKIGDALNIELPHNRQLTVTVVHVFNSYGSNEGRAIVDVGAIDTAGWTRDRVTINPIAGREAELQQRIASTSSNAIVSDNSERRTAALRVFDQTFVLTNAIALVAVIIAVVGLLSAALAMYGAQKQEFKLLRTVGIGDRTLVVSTLLQSGLFGFLACVIALPLGISIAWVLCEMVNPRAFQWTIDLHLDPWVVLRPTLLAFGAAVAACLIPFLLQRKHP
ncbi:MAG: ABC transporter permease [Gammaproteobacteria bacterium]|nr:ABC transporter permease [Gammaproteobacteria bacterium]